MRGIDIERMRISSTLLAGLEEFSAANRIDFQTMAAAVGLDYMPSDRGSDDDDRFFQLDKFAKLLEVGAILAGDDTFGFRFAMARRSGLEGPLSIAQLNAASFRVAVETMVKFIQSRIDLAHFGLVVDSERAILDWDFSPLLIRRWQLVDFIMGAFLTRLETLVEDDWRPLGVGLVRPPPKNPDLYRQTIKAPVEYSYRVNYIAFPAALLSLPIRNADAAVFNVSTRLLKRIARDRAISTDLLTAVREEIIYGLTADGGAQLSRVARRLGMSVRSLQRNLSECDTTFQDVVDETRRDLAARYLEDSELSFSQIAYQLGFSAPSAFTRASHRWFGNRPGAVRKAFRQKLFTHHDGPRVTQ